MGCQVSTECWCAAPTGKGENTGSRLLVYIVYIVSNSATNMLLNH